MAGLLLIDRHMMCRYLRSKIRKGVATAAWGSISSGEAQSPTDIDAFNNVNEHGGKTGPPAGRCFCRAP